MNDLLQGHDYLRLSVTDRCNLRCRYCMPEEGIAHLSRNEILSFGEIERLVRILAKAGVTKVKITGGEPLLRRGIVQLIARIASIPAVQDLSMTTNGLLLSGYAASLRSAGLQRVNVSLDTLSRDRFRTLTRGGRVERVLAGIDAALDQGLRPVKINVVLIRGFNDDEIPGFLQFARQKKVFLKFVEEMPSTANLSSRSFESGLAPLVLEKMEELGQVEPLEGYWPGPARCYRVSGLEQPVGIVSAISAAFCASCARLRITADGRLRPCLYSDYSVDLRAALKGGASDEEIISLVGTALERTKKEGGILDKLECSGSPPSMVQIGG